MKWMLMGLLILLPSVAWAGDVTISGAASGDIEGVTAGNGLTGGGTSGTVTVDAAGTANEIEVSADAIGLVDSPQVVSLITSNTVTGVVVDTRFLENSTSSNGGVVNVRDAMTVTGILVAGAHLNVTNGATGPGALRFFEDTDNGTNYLEFIAPSAITTTSTCTLENDGNPIPDSCVGDGTDGGGAGGGATDLNLPVYSAKLTGAYTVFTPPTADACSQGAQIDAGDGNWRLLFDATTDECATWQVVLPSNYASDPLLKVIYSMASATADDVEFEGAIMCITPGDAADIGTASFSNVAVASDTVPGTAGHPDTVSITLTDDSCAAGDVAFVVLSTDANDATNDDATGDREVVGVYFDYTGS